MKVRFFGVRGSIACGGQATQRYGGNTSCVVVDTGDAPLIFDAGTGIRDVGCDLGPTDIDAHLFLSHLHWDHIQGFPFFTPAFVPGNRLHVYAGKQNESAPSLRDVLSSQMRAPNFPVPLDIMRADLSFDELTHDDVVKIGQTTVRHTPVDHPNGCVAYRIDQGGRSIVYATDLEHPKEGAQAGLLELCKNADLLIYDAMYTPEEYEGEQGMPRHGWGHSTYEAGARLAESAGVKELVLFHHDPAHDDAFMDTLSRRAQKRFANTRTAKEGMEITL